MSQELPDRFPFKLGRYRVVAPLGEGAQGSVYQAFLEGPLSFQLRVALKVVPLDGPEPDRLVKALANEARALAAVYHPNVVRIHDFAKVQAWYLLAVEYVEGVDLRGLLRSFTDQGVGVPPALTAEIARQVAAGLAAMHALTDAAGEPSPVVHRDLKPANVLLSRHGAVKLADFGLAKGKQIAFHTTRANVTRGTPPYMSPE